MPNSRCATSTRVWRPRCLLSRLSRRRGFVTEVRAGERAALEPTVRQAPPHDPGAGVTLAVAQLVIARELGFASWPKLKAAVELRAGIAQRTAAFLSALVEGHPRLAGQLLDEDPRLAQVNVRAAAVVGETPRVEQLLAADPSVVHRVDRERGWPPRCMSATRTGIGPSPPGRPAWWGSPGCCLMLALTRTPITAPGPTTATGLRYTAR